MKLAIRGLGHALPSGRVLYRDLNVDFVAGEITAVIGPNGAGKSTLLRQLAAVESPQHGSVLLNGTPCAQVGRRLRATQLAYLPQQTELYYTLEVAELVLLGRAPFIGRFASASDADYAAVAAALHAVELDDLAERSIDSLSGGERQRVMVARMLATQAPVLVLDEPTTALDIGHTLALLELLLRLAREGRTVIVAMHELELARRYAAHVLCLDGHGGAQFGEAPVIMTCEALSRVFGVDARPAAPGIGFFASNGSGA
jgi:iron complex transport system ATP-binding protein